MLFTIPGVPSIYYASEFALTGEKRGGADGDDAVRPSLDIKKLSRESSELIPHIQKLAELRNTNQALQMGKYKELLVRNEQLVYVRELDNDYVMICLNCSDRPQNLNFQYNRRNYQFIVQPHSSVVFPKPARGI